MRRLSGLNGGLAQLGEHLLCKQGVVGSIPSSSTRYQGSGFQVSGENAVPISVNRKKWGLWLYLLRFMRNGCSLKIWKKVMHL